MKRNAPRVNNPARLARLRDQAIKLRERVKRSKLAFLERSQARFTWWQRAFRVPMVADWAIFANAKTLLSAFMALLGLASGKKSSLVALMVAGPLPRAYSNRRRLHVEGLEQRQLMAADFPEFVDPRASFAGNQFGHTVVALNGGNVVITSPFDDAGGTNAGAVYLFNGTTGALISTLTGSKANDNVGIGGVTALSNGNYVVMSASWDNGAVVDAGAVTFGSGTTGAIGPVSATNSLVGSTNGDMSTAGVTALKNGSYVVRSPLWNNGSVVDAGAVTFGGSTGVSGVISASNSLVGSTTGDMSFGSVTALNNGNYVVDSWQWDNGSLPDVGAVTFGSGTLGVRGAISAANSLIGTKSSDQVGRNGVMALSNGNYVVTSQNWDNGSLVNSGAATFVDVTTTGIIGVVSTTNSLVGSKANDAVGAGGATALSNGNYVVRSINWQNVGAVQAGAVTFGDGTIGVKGVVSSINSLVGSRASDNIGNGGVTALSNGSYVVMSPVWNNGSVVDAGAVTFGSTAGTTGVVSETNSLVGSTTSDQVGSAGVTALSNGSYVVRSPLWNSGTVLDAGAVTFGIATGISGAVSVANSLIGSTTGDNVGSGGVTALSNGSYVVMSPDWDNGAAANAGAVTFRNSTAGVNGAVVSTTNSLVGSTTDDKVGSAGVTALTNGNYVVASPLWNRPSVVDAGAITFGSGTTGVSGAVSATNSLAGSSTSDGVGSGGVTALSNGNYVVTSPNWDDGTVVDAGAITFGNGTTGVSGTVLTTNRVIGLAANTGLQTVVVNDVNGHFFGRFTTEGSGRVRLGSQVDGFAASVNLSVSASSGTEAGTTVITVTATASAAVSGPQTVTLGVAGTNITTGDYSLSGTTITIPNGQTIGSVTFTVTNDSLVEAGTETATLTISNPSSGLKLGTTTSRDIIITDNDTATVSINNPLVIETNSGTTLLAFTVSLDKPVDVAVTATTNTADGTTTDKATLADSDYVAITNGTVTFSAGSTSQTVNVTINGDRKVEPNEQLQLVLSALSAGGRSVQFSGAAATSTGIGTIVNDDLNGAAPVLTVNDTSRYVEDAVPILVAPTLTLTTGQDVTGATVSLTTNFNSAQDSLQFTNQNGISGSYNAATGILKLSGSASVATYQTALRSVTYSNNSQNPTTAQRSVQFSIGSTLANPTNGHFYEFVPAPGGSWTNANTGASSRKFFGLQGYLATVTSASENAFIAGKLIGQGWMGASDAEVEGTWKWVTGPEAGQIFWKDSAPVNGMYNKWSPGEPNNFGSAENYGHFRLDTAWNDYKENDENTVGYVVEYGGMLDDPTPQLTGTANVIVVAVNDAPTGANKTLTTSEGTQLTIVAADLGFSDVVEGHAFNGVKITTLPATGTLRLNGVAISAGDFATKAQLDANQLMFNPVANAIGSPYTAFTFQVEDDGGTANGGVNLDLTPKTITINVSKTNKVPVALDSSVTTNEITPKAFAVSDFLFTDVERDSLASITISSLNLASGDTLMLGSTNVAVDQTIPATNFPNLIYTPAASTKGAVRSTFGFKVNDAGNGTVAATMTINVTNDFVYHAPLLSGLDLDVIVRNGGVRENAVLVVLQHNTNIELLSKKILEIAKLVDIKTTGKVYIPAGLWTDGDEVRVTASEIQLSGSVKTVKDGSTESGNLTLIARNKSNDIVSGITGALPIFAETRSAKITLTNANLDVGTVEIKAEGQSGARWDDVGGIGAQIAGTLLTQLQALPQILLSELSELPLSGQAKVHEAKANITLANSTIKSNGNVAIGADAFADASINAISLSGTSGTSGTSLPVSISIAFSHSFSEATIQLNGTSKIEAPSGNIEISTNAESKSKVDAKSDANTGDKEGIEAAFNLALAMTEETSTILVSKDTQITSSGSTDITSKAKVHNESKAATSIFKDGTGALTVALGYDNANVKTEVNGKITSRDTRTQDGFTVAVEKVLPDTRRIELKDVPPSQVVQEGDRLRFESDAVAGAYGLVPGESYIVESVTNSEPFSNGTIDQSFRLRRGEIVSLDARQVSEGSKHSLRKIDLAYFKNSDVAALEDKSGIVKLTDLPAGVTIVTYRGPKFEESNSSNESDEVLVGIEGLTQDQDYQIVPATGGGYHLRQVTKLKKAIDNKSTTTTVALKDISIFSQLNAVDPTKDSFPFNILIGGEEMRVVSRSGTDLTVVRAVNGTTRADHAMDAFVSTVINVQFKLPTLTGTQATQIHAFAYTKNIQTFEPSKENVVDPKANTILLPANHGFKTGDFVIYETDDTKKVEKTVQYYDKDGKQQDSLGKVSLPDAPIDGLGDYHGYRVIVDPSNPNLIRLSSLIQMEKLVGSATPTFQTIADTVVLNKTPVDGNHRLVPLNLVQGINISSSLEAENTSEAGSTMSDEEQPATELASNSLSGRLGSVATGGKSFIDSLRKGATKNAVNGAPTNAAPPASPAPPAGAKAIDQIKTASGSKANFDVAGSFALNLFKHNVSTTIGSKARLVSASDLTVDGKIEQKNQLNASAEATRNGVGEADGTVTAGTATPTTPPADPPAGEKRDEIEIAAAVAVGVYSNVLKVSITDGAVVNAADDLQVNAKVDYPMLTDSILDAINPLKSLEENGLAGFEDILDGSGGIGQMFNVSVATLAGTETAKLALGGGIAVTYVTNEVTAEIGKDVLVNQPETPPIVPDPTDPTQSVTVTAELTAKVIEVGQQSSFNLNIDGAAGVGEKLFSKDFANALSDLVVPLGVSGKSAIGGVMVLSIVDNKVKAIIHDNAKVKAKDRVGVDAKNAYSNISVVQTGTASTDFGFTAAIAVGVFDLTTLAFIDETVTITTGKLAVNAQDESDRIAIVGGFLKGKQVGIGTSVGVNVVDQQVDAYIGRLTPDSRSAVPLDKTISASEEVKVTATTKGEIFALVMAGALQGSLPEKPAAKAQSTTTTTPATNTTNPSKSSILGPIALTIPVSVNVIDSNVRAYIDRQNFETKSVSVEAFTATSMLQVVVGASFAVQTQKADPKEVGGKLTLGGAGAVALAIATQNATAFIQSSRINATGSSDAITVKATDKSESDIYAGGIGVAGSFTKDGKAAISFGASVAINDLDGATKAYISQSQITASGAVNVNAIGNAKIFTLSIAGGASANLSAKSSGAFAGGGTVSINDIEKTIEASILSNTELTVTTNAPTIISARDQSQIFAIAGAAGIAVSASTGKSISGALGIALAINEISNTVTAKLDRSTVDTKGDLTIDANSPTDVSKPTSEIKSFAVAASVGVSKATGVSVSLAGAGAGSLNDIKNKSAATLTASTVTGTGTLNVLASDGSKIESYAIGASISAAKGETGVAVSVGASLGLNDIQNTVQAVIAQGAVINSPAVTRLKASSNSTIDAVAVAASVAIGAGGKAGVAVSGAGAAAKNVILSKTNAFIDQSTLNTAGKVDIDAMSESKIDAKVISASVSVGAGDKAGVSASVGVAVARNFIGWQPAGNTSVNTTDTALTKILKGTTVKVLGGVYDGDVYEFIGKDPVVVYDYTSEVGLTAVKESTRVKVGPAVYRFKGKAETRNLTTEKYETNTADWELIGESDLSGQDFGKRDLWKLVLPATIEDAATIQAYIRNSTITATGAVTLDAVSNQTIDAVVIAGSVALAASSKVGVAFSGAAVGTENRIRTLVKAYVDKSTVSAKDLLINAHDTATIKADAGAASVAGSAGGKVGVSLSIGVALAFNEISNEVEAYIANSSNVTTPTGNVVLNASSRGGSPEAQDYTSKQDGQTLKLGDRVKVDLNHTAGGKTGRIYSYRGFADFLSSDKTIDEAVKLVVKPGHIVRTVGESPVFYKFVGTVEQGAAINDLSGQNYLNTSQWQLVKLDLSKIDFSDTSRWELADASIRARTGAASIAASFGEKAGVAVSGAGAFAQNVINTKTNATIKNSTLKTGGEVKLDAVSDASISAIVGAVSVAVGVGGKAGVGVSIGAAIALNTIGSAQKDGNFTSEVLAYVDQSKIDAANSLTLSAMGNQNIDAIVLAGSVAAAGGETAGVGVSAAGAVAINNIGSHIAAYIDNSASLGTIKAKSISLSAQDMSKISTVAGAASIAAALGGKAGVAVSVGVALAFNEIHNKVEAYFNKIDVMAPTGDISLNAMTGGAINAIAAAASVSIGVGGKAGVAVSGAGALAKNVILSKTNAFIDQSTLNTAGKVDIDAMSESTIDAIIVAASVAVGVGDAAGVGASVGVAVARNFIGWQPAGNTSDKTTDNSLATIPKGTTVKVLGGVYDGDVYEFIGKDAVVVYDYTSEVGQTAVKENTRVKVGPAVYRFKGNAGTRDLRTQDYENNTADWELIGESDLSGQDFGKRDLWKLVLPATIQDAATIQAYIRNSAITATGVVTLDALSNQAIDAVVFAGSVALAASSKVGVAFSGAGVGTENRIRTLVKAYVDSGSSTVSAKDLLIKAHDTATIKADAGAASVAGSAGGKVGVSLSFGVALAFNEISNEVAAYIANSANVKTTGNVVLNASSRGGSPEAENYTSKQDGQTALKLGDRVKVENGHTAGGKPGRIYSYRGLPGAVDLQKADYSETLLWELADASIRARTGAASIAASFGGAAGVAVSGAGAFAQNVINTKTNATIKNSTLQTGGEVKLDAVSDASISAIVGAVSVAVAAGGKAGVGVSIGAAIALNTIGSAQKDGIFTSEVLAYVDQSKIDAKSLSLSAMGNQNIDAIVLAGSVAAAGGGVAGVGVSAAGAVAINKIGSHIAAYIENSASPGAIKAESISLSAEDKSKISTVAGAASIAAALGGVAGVAVSVGVALASNEIRNKVEAYIINSDVMTRTGDISLGDISLNAISSGAINAKSAAASLSIGVGGKAGVAVSGAGALSKNEINNQTLSSIKESTLVTKRDLKVKAEDDATIDGLIIAASVAVGGGLVGVGAALGLSSVENIIPATALTQAKISGGQFTVGGSVTVDASSTGEMNSDVNAVSIGFAAGAVGVAAAVAGVLASHDLSGKVEAQIQGSGNKENSAVSGVTVQASNNITSDLDVKSASVAAAIGGGGAVSLGVSSATTTLKPIVTATIRDAKLISSSGDIKVTADNNGAVKNDAATASVAASYGGFAIAGGGASATVTATPQVNAMVQDSDINGKNVTVSANSTDTVDADSLAAAIAISIGGFGLGASGSISKVTLEPVLKSEVVKTKVVSENGTLNINTKFTPMATAESAGLAVGTGAAVGLSSSDVMIGGSLISRLDAGDANNKPIKVGALNILTKNNAAPTDGTSSSAKATGASGGLLLGANGAIANIANTTKSTAEIADNNASNKPSSAITVTGKTDISVKSATSQTAEAGSLAVGLLSSGNTLTEAKSDNGTTARIGKNVILNTGDLDLQSISVDNSISTAKLGSFGGIGIALSKGETTTRSITKAIIDDGAKLTVTGKLDADANHTAKYNAKLLSLSGGFISGSGGAVNNVIDSTVNVNIGSRTMVTAGRMDATATNTVKKEDPGTDDNVDADAKGLIAGVKMNHDTTLKLNTTTTIGDNAKIVLTADDAVPSKFEAFQDIKIKDKVKFKAGGLAAGGALVTNIKSTDHNIGVTVGGGVQMDAKTPIHFAANEKADVTIQANSDAYGAATATGNKATIDLKPIKSVTIGSYAKVFSTKDVALLAGMTSNPENPKKDDYKIKSNVDAFAGSLIPLDTIDANAHLLQKNTIDVTQGAEVKSGGDILLYADGDDYQPVSAQAKSVNWISGLSALVNGATSDAEGGVGQFAGESSTKADATVTVKGTLETGIGRNRTLVIEKIVEPQDRSNISEYKVVLSKESDFSDADIKKSSFDVISEDAQALLYAKEQLRIPGVTSQLKQFYEAEVVRLREKITKQGLLESYSNDLDVVTKISTLNLFIPNITASSGAVRIFADTQVVKDGTLTAPSDPSITVINNTYANLTTSILTIPDHNGGVFFNGRLTTERTATPTIKVENEAIVAADTGKPWPGIEVQQSVNNPSGDVTLKNYSAGAGAINIAKEASIQAATQTIEAGLNGTLNISLGGANSVFEAGGSAYKQVLPFSEPVDQNGRLKGLGTGAINNFANQPVNALNGSTSVLRGARIILKAAYINLNGLIESGRTDYTLLITDAMHREAGEYGQLQKPGLYKLKTNSNPDFTVQFNTDPVGYEYVVSDFAPVGGYVEIHGHLANTGGGKIQVASGYASVKIKSEVELNHPIRLQNIDLSQRADGRLVIDDEYKPGQSTIYESHGDYIYKSKSGSVERRELTSTDTYQPKDWLRYGFTIVEDLREVITEYHKKNTGKKPLFAWADFGTDTKIFDKVIPQGTPRLSTSGVFFFEAPGDAVQFRYDSDRTETGTTKTPRYNEETRYGYFTDDHYWQVDTTTGVTIKHNHSMRADNPIVINFTGLKEPKLDVNWTNGRVTIDGIIGDDRGVTNIKNTGPVFTTDRGLIQGRQITLTANQFGTPASPVRTDLTDKVVSDYLSDEPFKDDSPLRKIYGGERVRVGANHTAGGLPGTVYVYRGLKPLTQRLLTVNYADATLWQPVGNDSQMIITNVSTGDTNIHEVSGDLIIGGIYIQGNTWLRAAGGIQMAVEGASIKTFGYYYQGNPSVLNLVADTGDIGTTKMPVQIRTTSGVSFSAKTPGNVSLFSIRQLFVNEIQAGGDVAIRFAPGFSMADANFIDIRDERAIEELTNTVWKDLQLTKDTGFDAKLASRIAALQAIKTSEYRTYWDLRNQTSDPKNYTSGAQVVMSQGQFDDLRPTLEQEGRMAGFSGDDLVLYFFLRRAEIDIDRTKELHRLHLVVGALTAAFDPTYKYTATDADKKEIKDSMHLWTEQQLQNLRDPSFVASFLKITDTELVIEKPNIIGKTVRIEASGVGTYDHGQTIVLKDAGGNRPKLTLDQRAAVIAAESGDLIFTTRPPVDVAITVQDNYKLTLSRYTKNQDVPYGGTGTWGELGFQVGQSIMLAGEPGSTTDRGVFYKVKSISQDGKILEVDSVMTDGSAARPVHSRPIDNSDYGMDGLYLVAPVITDPAKYNEATHLYVLRREDVDIQSEGKIDVIAASHIFIGSEGDMLLGAIGLAGPGTIQIKANGDLRRSGIEDLLLGNVIRGNVVLLESANGKIGDTGKPLRIGKNDEAILRAKGDIRAESSDKSQLRVKNVYSGTGDVDLKFPGGFVDLCSADVAIRANKINLATDNSLGDIKGISCPFTIDGKTINAKAKDIDLKSTGDLIVGKKAVSAAGGEGEILPEIEGLFATGNLRLESLGSLTILGTMSAGGEMFVSATGQLIAIPESRVLSNGPVTLVLNSLAGSSSPAKFDFLGELNAPSTVIHGSDGPDTIRFAPAASSSGEVQLTIDKLDSINYGTNYKAGRPTVKDGQFFHVLTSGAQKMLVKNSVRNTNPILPLDVTADGSVGPLDTLVVINLLNRLSRPDWLASDRPMSSEELDSFAYYDVNADNSIDPLDVLTIINFLNRREGSGEGEFVSNPGVAITSFIQAQINADAVRVVHGKDKLQGGRDNDLLIEGTIENQDDLASLDAALADWSSGDWALALFDLGDINDDDDLKGEEGLDMLFGGFGLRRLKTF